MLLRRYRALLRSLEVPCLDFALRFTCVAFLCVTILLIYLPLKRSLRLTSRRDIADMSSVCKFYCQPVTKTLNIKGGGLAQLVATLVRSAKLLYAGPG